MEYSCSFCGKPQSFTAKLIRSPDGFPEAYICDECVEVALSMLEDANIPLQGLRHRTDHSNSLLPFPPRHPVILREIARIAFEGVNGKRLRKLQEIATELRKLGIIPQVKDDKDTRGVQELIDETAQWLLRRSDFLTTFEMRILLSTRNDRLSEKYPSLLYCTVVLCDQDLVSRQVSSQVITVQRAAATYLEETFISRGSRDDRQESHVAISGGIIIHQIVNNMRPIPAPFANFYASVVLSRPCYPSSHISSETNATVAWSRAGMINDQLFCTSLQGPALSDLSNESDEFTHQQRLKELAIHAKECFQHHDHVKQALRNLSQIDTLITSIDSIQSTPIATTAATFDFSLPYLKDNSQAHQLLEPYGISSDLLARDGAIGSFNYSFFDRDGKERDEWKVFLTPGYPNSLDFYRQRVADNEIVAIGVCTNPATIPAIHVALKTGLFNVLFIDSSMARALIEYEG